MKKLSISNDEILVTSDKEYVPFLLACSFHQLINFNNSYSQNGIVYWEFYPKVAAKTLIGKYEVKLPMNIPEKDIIEATNIFWRKVYDAKTDY